MRRRHFMKTTGSWSTLALLAPYTNLSGRMPGKGTKLLSDVGIQLFSIPWLLENDIAAALEMLSDMGYSKLELFGPYPFSADSAKERWKALTPQLGFSGSGYFNQEMKNLKELLRANEMSVPSIHTDLDTLENKMDELAKAGEELGFEYVVLPALPADKRENMEAYKKTAELFNKIGKNALDHGLKFTYHNHGYGLQETEGQIPLQYLIEHTDPKGVILEMDLFWTTAGKADPMEYLDKYPGRYKLMHVKDMKEKRSFSGDGGDPGQWMELFPMMCSAGSGVIEIDKIIPKAIESGVEHFIVEQDLVKEPETALRKSIDYLKSL